MDNGVGITSGWQNVRFAPLSHEQKVAPHVTYNGQGQGVPAAAVSAQGDFYDHPKETHGFRNFMLGTMAVLGILYLTALGGRKINIEGAGKFKQTVQSWSETGINKTHGLFQSSWNGIKGLKDRIFKKDPA